MPRSSKHKSSKHSSRDYSDSEIDSGAKDRKSKDDSSSVKVAKNSSGAEKRRLDSKEVHVHGNGGEYSEEYGLSSKRRRESGGGGGDRWNGGDEGSKKSSKAIGDSRDSRDLKNSKGEEVKRSSGRHRDSFSSGRKENVEKEKEKDRKVKEGRIEESVDADQDSFGQQNLTKSHYNSFGQQKQQHNLERRQLKKKSQLSSLKIPTEQKLPCLLQSHLLQNNTNNTFALDYNIILWL